MTAPRFYIDTSALLKKYRTEIGTEVVAELFDDKRESEALITSYFTVLEVTSVTRRLLAAGTLSRRLYQRVLGNFERDLATSFWLQSVSDGVVREAIRLSTSHVLRAPDAIHLATAVMARPDTDESFYFVCSDAKLLAASENVGIPAFNPEAPDATDLLRSCRARGG